MLDIKQIRLEVKALEEKVKTLLSSLDGLGQWNLIPNIELEVVCHFIEEGNVFLDVGANAGIFTEAVNKKCDGNVEIHSFEPHPAQYHSLSQDNWNNKNIKCYNVAVTNFIGKTKLWYRPEDDGNQFGGSTIIDELAVPRRLGTSMDYIEADAITLDSLNLSPDVIKIDTEGAESNILEGASKTIQKYKPIIILEYGADGPEDFEPRSVEILKSYGYKFFWNIEDHCKFNKKEHLFCNILAMYEETLEDNHNARN